MSGQRQRAPGLINGRALVAGAPLDALIQYLDALEVLIIELHEVIGAIIKVEEVLVLDPAAGPVLHDRRGVPREARRCVVRIAP